MNFTVFDETKVKEWDSKLETILQTIERLNKENISLKDNRLMSVGDVADYTGFSKQWVVSHKEEIGYSQIGTKDLRFYKDNVDAYFNSKNHYIKKK